MQSISQPFEAEYKVKGSKFLSCITPCDSPENAETALGKAREAHPSASHHCFAYRIDPHQCFEHSQDDGEPGGTAGPPILNTLRSFEMINVIGIVVRYYGGTNLGKSGLIDAYGTAAKFAIQQANLKKIVPTTRYLISYPYNQQTLIDKLKHTYTLFEIEAEYTERVQLKVECPEAETPRFEKRLQSIDHLLDDVEKRGKSYQFN